MELYTLDGRATNLPRDGEWDFHTAIVGAKIQVNAQYGESSDEVQSVGLKKKSEYMKPARKGTGKKGSFPSVSS